MPTRPGDRPQADIASTFDGILVMLDKVNRYEHRATARCPAHEDGSPSLSLRLTDDRILIHCFGGCETGAVLKALWAGENGEADGAVAVAEHPTLLPVGWSVRWPRPAGTENRPAETPEVRF